MQTTNTFTTEQEYKEAKHKSDTNQAAFTQYLKGHKGSGIPVEICKTFPYADEVTNDLRSKIEVYEFIHDIPKKYFLYIDEKDKTATTWTGSFLGNVRFGREYRTNFGDKRQPIDVYAVNGKRYHGIYYKSAGSYARITLYK